MENRKKIIAVDIDGVLTESPELNDFGKVSFEDLKKGYYNAKPNKTMIKKVNKARDKYTIILFTSRSDYFREITIEWLRKQKIHYDYILFNKPYYHYIIDDRAVNDIPM